MKNNVFYFTRLLSQDLKKKGRNGTARSYICAVNRLVRFLNKYELTFEEITPSLLKNFEQHLLSDGKARNTVSMYMRMLRSICNQAIDQHIVSLPANLFKDVFTGGDSAQKRAVSTKLIMKLGTVDTTHSRSLTFTQDMFLLSFYLRGIPFVDLAHLRKTDINMGVLRYRRSKTNKELTVVLENCALDIFKKYEKYVTRSPYLLPIIERPGHDEYQQYQSALRLYNKNLEIFSDHLKLKTRLTSYVPRHSWATAAYRQGIPVSIISEALGHSSEEVTYHYLASFDDKTLRNANRKVLSLIGKKGRQPTRSQQKIKLPRRKYQIITDDE